MFAHLIVTTVVATRGCLSLVSFGQLVSKSLQSIGVSIFMVLLPQVFDVCIGQSETTLGPNYNRLCPNHFKGDPQHVVLAYWQKSRV